jgi:hypothetical protein
MAESNDRVPSELSATPAVRRRRCAVYLAITAAYLVLAVYAAASGPRGSDQFWYISDVTTLMAGSPPYTNVIYPGTMIREKMPPEATPFVHHTLTLYLAAALGTILGGAYPGWIAMTMMATLAAAWLVSRVVKRLADEPAALWAFAIFLLWPTVFWQSVNMLQEGFFVLFVAAIVYLFLRLRQTVWHYLLLELLLLVAALCSPFFVPLLFLTPLTMLVHFGRPVRWPIVLVAAGLLAATVAVLAVEPVLFPAAFQPGLAGILRGVDPISRSNMVWQARVELPELSPHYVWLKFVWAVQSQFAGDQAGLVFYWPVNLTILLALLLLWRHRGAAERRLAGLTALLLLMYAGVVVCHQNQFRYGIFILPATIPCAVVLLARLGGRPALRWLVPAAGALALAAFLAIDVTSAQRIRGEAKQYAAFREAAQKYFAGLSDADHVIFEVDGSGPEITVGFAIYPRKVMALLYAFTPEVYRQIREGFPARWLIAKKDSKLLELYNASPQPEWRLPEPYSQFNLYRLPARPQSKSE